MNYLKSYKIFEKNESVLMDCLVELFDYGFEIEHMTSKKFSKFIVKPQQLLMVKLFKRFPESMGKFSNRLEGEFDKDSFVQESRKRGRLFHTQERIEDELIEMTDEASNKIINTYIPEATRGEYLINEYVSSNENVLEVVIVLKFFK